MIRKICFVYLVSLLSVSAAWATGSGGFRIFASDSEAAGKGYAFVAEADNPSAVYYNPAGLTQLKGDNHVSVGMAAIQPMVNHIELNGDENQMQRETFLIPHVYAVSDFNLSRVVFGLGSTSNWGLSTKWNPDSFSGYSAVKTELENIDNTLTASYEVNKNFSIAAGLVLSISKLSKTKNINQATSTDATAQLKGDDNGVGYTISSLYKLNERHQFGFIYRSPIELTYEGEATAHGLNDNSPLAAQKYFTIFGNTTYSTPFEADLEIPQNVALGYSFIPSEVWKFNFDLDWTDWSSVENEYVNFPSESNATRIAILKALTGSDRDWKSVFSYAVGAEYSKIEDWVLRAGLFFNPTPIPNDSFESGVPINDAYGVTLGFGHKISANSTLDFAWTGMFYEDKEIENAFGDALGGNLDGTYENMINIASATWSYKF